MTSVKFQVPFVDLAAQHAALREELTAAWFETLDRSDFILGRAVECFEQEFAAFVGATNAVGMGTGLDALRWSLVAIGVGEGNEVLVPANSFIATALAVTECGARPVFVDCDERTYNMAPEKLTGACTSQTKAIIPVHFAGLPADMNAILHFAQQRGLSVVEDACQAHGATYHGQGCGTLGDAGCFSFYPAKNLGAFGDGGMVVTNQVVLAERLRQVRNYGQRAKYEHVLAGANSRLDTLQAAILRVKLKSLRAGNDARRRHASRYRELLDGVGDLQFQANVQDCLHVYHLYIVETEGRDGLRDHLAQRGIQTGIHYPLPIHLQAAYSSLGYRPGSFPVAERLATRCLSLPMYPELKDWQLELVAKEIREWFGC